MTLAYMTTPLLGITDTAVVGQFGDPAMIGGLAAGAIVLDLLFTSFNFLRSSTTGLVAQAVGRDDPTGEALTCNDCHAIHWQNDAVINPHVRLTY